MSTLVIAAAPAKVIEVIEPGPRGLPGPSGQNFKLDGSVATYAELPSNLTADAAGQAWLVNADGRVYVWSGTAWPADGAGAPLYPRGFSTTADGNVQSNSVVCATANGVANPDLADANDVLSIVGIAATAANDGGALFVQVAGELTEVGWNWTPGPVYCALEGGVLTQSAPQTGAVVQVATAINPTTLQVGIQPAILRSS